MNNKMTKHSSALIILIALMLAFAFCIIPMGQTALAATEAVNVITGFGYSGSTYYWNGRMEMTVSNPDSYSVSDSTYTVAKGSSLQFTIKTDSSKNAWTPMSGKINVIINDGSISQSHSTSLEVSIGNKVKISAPSFTFDTESKNAGTYTLTLESSISRGTQWTDKDVKTITIVVI